MRYIFGPYTTSALAVVGTLAAIINIVVNFSLLTIGLSALIIYAFGRYYLYFIEMEEAR